MRNLQTKIYKISYAVGHRPIYKVYSVNYVCVQSHTFYTSQLKKRKKTT